MFLRNKEEVRKARGGALGPRGLGGQGQDFGGYL